VGWSKVIRPVGRRVGIGLGNKLNFNTQISYFSRFNSRNAFKLGRSAEQLRGMLHAYMDFTPRRKTMRKTEEHIVSTRFIPMNNMIASNRSHLSLLGLLYAEILA